MVVTITTPTSIYQWRCVEWINNKNPVSFSSIALSSLWNNKSILIYLMAKPDELLWLQSKTGRLLETLVTLILSLCGQHTDNWLIWKTEVTLPRTQTITKTSYAVGVGSLWSTLEVRNRERIHLLTHGARLSGVNLAKRISGHWGQVWPLLQYEAKTTVKCLLFNFPCVRYSLCGLNWCIAAIHILTNALWRFII